MSNQGHLLCCNFCELAITVGEIRLEHVGIIMQDKMYCIKNIIQFF